MLAEGTRVERNKAGRHLDFIEVRGGDRLDRVARLC
jgi:hypothetical protein